MLTTDFRVFVESLFTEEEDELGAASGGCHYRDDYRH